MLSCATRTRVLFLVYSISMHCLLCRVLRYNYHSPIQDVLLRCTVCAADLRYADSCLPHLCRTVGGGYNNALFLHVECIDYFVGCYSLFDAHTCGLLCSVN